MTKSVRGHSPAITKRVPDQNRAHRTRSHMLRSISPHPPHRPLPSHPRSGKKAGGRGVSRGGSAQAVMRTCTFAILPFPFPMSPTSQTSFHTKSLNETCTQESRHARRQDYRQMRRRSPAWSYIGSLTPPCTSPTVMGARVRTIVPHAHASRSTPPFHTFDDHSPSVNGSRSPRKLAARAHAPCHVPLPWSEAPSGPDCDPDQGQIQMTPPYIDCGAMLWAMHA